MKSESITTIVLLLGLFLAMVFLPGVMWGGDGTLLWFPIVSEFLKSYEVYQNSLVFSGQNLHGIYGEVPLWNLFKVFNGEVSTVLNFTFFSWVFLSFFLCEEILRGIKKTLSSYDMVFLFLFVCFSPVVFNRVYAGHFNLLFGLFPLLVAMALSFQVTKRSLAISFFSLWFAFSIQSYQILIYHFFYIPFLVFFLKRSGSFNKRYFFSLLGVTTLAFIASWNSFSEMFGHATHASTARSLDLNVVYSYTVSQLFDFFNLVFAIPSNLTLSRGPGFYHELNYPIVPAALFFLFNEKSKGFRLTVALMILFLFLFSMGAFPFHFLADLPLIKSFRVPQRSLMPMAFVLPIICWGISGLTLKRKEFFITLGILFFAFFTPFFEIFLLLFLISFPIWRNKTTFLKDFLNKDAAMAMLLGSFILMSPFKVDHVIKTNQSFFGALNALKPLQQGLSAEERRNLTFHFYTSRPLLITSAANTLGFRTYEGYGHPPKEYLSRFEEVTNKKLSPLTNQFYFPLEPGTNDALLKAFNVDRKIIFKRDGSLEVEKLGR